MDGRKEQRIVGKDGWCLLDEYERGWLLFPVKALLWVFKVCMCECVCLCGCVCGCVCGWVCKSLGCPRKPQLYTVAFLANSSKKQHAAPSSSSQASPMRAAERCEKKDYFKMKLWKRRKKLRKTRKEEMQKRGIKICLRSKLSSFSSYLYFNLSFSYPFSFFLSLSLSLSLSLFLSLSFSLLRQPPVAKVSF